MPLSAPAPPNKRKKPSKIITDFANITQDADQESDPEASEFDLGTKIKTPKDTMLEELSLMKNRGSRMFQLRQQRVEKFIISTEHMQNLQELVPSLGCEMLPPVPPKPAAPEPVKEEVDEAAERERRRREHVKTYMSPWERAMKGDEELRATMQSKMPGPHVHKDMPKFKSFNRTALPFGGFEKGSKLLTFQPPEINTYEEPEMVPVHQCDIRSRPSFNRTPIGWVCNDEHSHIHMEMDAIPFDGETDDL
ncbi:myozenin-1b [Alosa pseudoharengus]|uniref:myozenin-1b n=1 Tax=Alosa pseudoharengus TaxID=34774 RepID=UPI003F8CD807